MRAGRRGCAHQPEYLAIRRADLRAVPGRAGVEPRRARTAAGRRPRGRARGVCIEIVPGARRGARSLAAAPTWPALPDASRADARRPVTRCWRLFVPGRLEVFGKHTDYAGGRSLVAAVPRGIAVRGSDRVRRPGGGGGRGGGAARPNCQRRPGPVSRPAGAATLAAVIRRLSRNFPGRTSRRASRSAARSRAQPASAVRAP